MEGIVLLGTILIFSVVLHEVSHGVVANSLGDPTAKQAGRLTLNPIPHLDPIGSFLVPISLFFLTNGSIFGWAKPVPVNPYNLRYGRYGETLVSFAGPASNFGLALVFGLALRFLGVEAFNPVLAAVFENIVILNLMLGVFNLLPVPPLDGSHILFAFLPASLHSVKTFLFQYGFLISLFIVFFFFEYVFLVVRLLSRLILGVS